jgi:fatty acid desaturase
MRAQPCPTDLQSMHTIVRDLFHEDRGRYARDFCRDAALGWGAFLLPLCIALPWPIHLLCLVVAIRGFYGLLSFLHEFAHRRGGAGLVTAWTVLFGTPFLVHGFMYLDIHKHHHSPRGYATDGDGEYVTLTERPRTYLLALILWNLALPILGVVRFGSLVPIGIFSARFRAYVHRNLSMAGMKFQLERPGPASVEEAADWRRHELMSMAFCWITAGGMALGWIPLEAAAQWYVVFTGVATSNAVRGIAAHRYAVHSDGSQVPLLRQLGDSLNVTGRSIATWFFCPNGIQYHALHHALPGIPYHALTAAHERIMRDLPAEADYRAVNVSSVWSSWRELILSMRPVLGRTRLEQETALR